MCGIIGYVGKNAPSIAGRLAHARDAMTHRGPDDAGLWQTDDVCLGERRLAVLDLSPAGHMPMISADGRHVIVFNGAIYNFIELRAELARSVEFRSTGDTEVILNGFRVWGWPALLDRLDGMFAFAIWDTTSRTLYAARDRLGEKPFFHARVGGAFVFASTLTALTKLRGGSTRVDAHALDAYLTYQSVPAPFSIFEGCNQLAPAHALVFDSTNRDVRISRYWDIAFAPKRRVDEREAIDTIDSLTRQAVSKRLRSDVPTGTLLSGGVDSSIITAIASQESEGPVDAVTMGYDGPDDDERRFARVVADRCGARLHEELLAPSVVRDLPSIVWQYGQPLADVSIVPNYYLAAAARRVMTVALVGDGADEAFGGYARPVIERAAQPYRRWVPSSVRRGLASLLAEDEGQRESNPIRRRLALLANDGRGSARDAFVYDRGFRSLRDLSYAGPLRSAVTDWNPDQLYASAWDRAVGVDDVDRAMYGDLTTYLPDQLLAKADVSAMAFGLETRSPFLAREILEYAATLPTELRLRHYRTKYLLKRVAERYVPSSVIYRRKRGFVIPVSQWLRSELAPYVSAALDSPQFLDRGWLRADAVRQLLRQHADGSHDWGQQIWTLLVLDVWARLTLDGSIQSGDSLDTLLGGSAVAAMVNLPVKPVRNEQRRRLQTLQIGLQWFSEQPGGLNRVYANLLNEFAAQGVECVGLVAGTPDVAIASHGMARAFATVRSPVLTRMRRLRAAAVPWLKTHGREAVVVSHFAQHAFPILDYLTDRPFVVHFQGPWGQESRVEGARYVSWRAKEAMERRVYSRADAAIVLSAPFGDILATRFGVSREKIHVIPGGVEVARFASGRSRTECRAELGWPTDRPIVLCVRRLVRRVGLDVLIDAAVEVRRQVPDVLILIAGTGRLREELEAQIVSRSSSDSVRFLGFLPDDQLPTAYRAADLTVVPSVMLEGFGLITIESLAAGTPCVVTPVGGLTDIMTPFAPQLIASSSAAADIAETLSNALLGRIDVPSAEVCAEYARANFDWPVIADRVRRVYEQVLT